MTKNNPWLALSTYEEKDKEKFKGRDKDIANMLTMLQQNECVVCYAASGDGKSSLINAGLCPEIRKFGMFPVKISFTTTEYDGIGLPHISNENPSVDFDQLILNKIKQSIDRYRVEFAKKYGIGEDYIIEFERIAKFGIGSVKNSLWWKLRTETIQVPFGAFDYIPVLIFDQFEEIFRASWRTEFFMWLEQLMKDVCPESLLLENQTCIPSKKMFKTIFSLRYEFVGELDYWCSQRVYIPQVMQNRYFLKPLSRNQAISVIQDQKGDDIVSEKMIKEADLIVGNIAANSIGRNNDIDEISAIVLSLVCFVLYDKWSENINYSLKDIDLNDIIYDFYIEKLHKVGVPDNARQSIEAVLISSKNTRLRMPISDIRLQKIEINKYVYTDDDVPNLKTEHLIKLESSNGEDYIEFIHDRLSDAIFKRREYEREQKQAFLKLESRKNYGYISAIFLFLIVFLFVTYKSLTLNAWYADDFIKGIDDKKLVVTQYNYKDYSWDYLTATSLSLESNLCLHKLDCFENVLYSKDYVNYAHNAERLVFARQISGLDSLSFGENTRKVILLYPQNFKKIFCANQFTEVYVPKGDYDKCLHNDISKDIHIKELGWLSLFWEKLKYEFHIQHTHLIDSDISIPLWISAVFSFFLILFFTKKYWEKYDTYKRITLFLGGAFIFTMLSVEYIELHWLGFIDNVNLGIPFVIMLILWYAYEYIRKIRPNSVANRSQYCIIYCSEDGKSIAIKLRKALIDTRMEGDDDDFVLDLSIVRYGEFHPDVVVSSMEKSKQCIAVFDKCDIKDNNRVKSFVSLLENQKFLHPVIVGFNGTQDFLVPFDVQQFFQRKDIVFFNNVEQIETNSDNIIKILSSIRNVKNYGCIFSILWVFIKYIVICFLLAVVLWFIQMLKR